MSCDCLGCRYNVNVEEGAYFPGRLVDLTTRDTAEPFGPGPVVRDVDFLLLGALWCWSHDEAKARRRRRRS